MQHAWPAKQVNNFIKRFDSTWMCPNSFHLCTQGQRTAHIAYDKIHGCNDRDVSFAVWIYVICLELFRFFSWPQSFYSSNRFQLTQLSIQVADRHPIATCGLFLFDWTLVFTVKEIHIKTIGLQRLRFKYWLHQIFAISDDRCGYNLFDRAFGFWSARRCRKKSNTNQVTCLCDDIVRSVSLSINKT